MIFIFKNRTIITQHAEWSVAEYSQSQGAKYGNIILTLMDQGYELVIPQKLSSLEAAIEVKFRIDYTIRSKLGDANILVDVDSLIRNLASKKKEKST